MSTVTITRSATGWSYHVHDGDGELTEHGPLDSLESLLYALRVGDLASNSEAEWDSLPTFGGDEPADTQEVWSWDEFRLLIGTCADDLEIVERSAC